MPEIRGATDAAAALWQALTGSALSTAKKASTQQKVRAMMTRWGTTKNVAKKVGVSQRTVQRWLKGEQEAKNTRRSANADKLNRAFREAKITKGRADKFKSGGASPGIDPASGRPIAGVGGITIYGRFRVSEDERDRVINAGNYIPDGQLDRVIDVMIEHGPEAAVESLNTILDNYVPGMQTIAIYQIDY